MVKNLPTNSGDIGGCGFNSWVGKIPWSRKWQSTPVFLPGKFPGKRAQRATTHEVAKIQT